MDRARGGAFQYACALRMMVVIPWTLVPTFVLEWCRFGAPDRMKLGTLMSLFVKYNSASRFTFSYRF